MKALRDIVGNLPETKETQIKNKRERMKQLEIQCSNSQSHKKN